MSDREKVVNGLEWILNDIEENGRCHVNYYAGEIRNVLALLKEQEPVVRCKDCKRRLECDYWIENGDDWFCADGKRR